MRCSFFLLLAACQVTEVASVPCSRGGDDAVCDRVDELAQMDPAQPTLSSQMLLQIERSTGRQQVRIGPRPEEGWIAKRLQLARLDKTPKPVSAAAKSPTAPASLVDARTTKGITLAAERPPPPPAGGTGTVAAPASAMAKDLPPDVEDVVESAWDSAQDITSKIMKGQTDDAITEGQQALVNFTHDFAAAAAPRLAAVLNDTLLALENRTIGWKASCYAAAVSVVHAMNRTFNDTREELTALETEVTNKIGNFLPVWTNISKEVRTSMATADAAVKLTGMDWQDNFTIAVNEVVAGADAIAQGLGETTHIVHGLDELAEDEAMGVLRDANASLERTIGHIEDLADEVDLGLETLIGELAILINANFEGIDSAAVNASFASVSLTARHVVEDILQGPESVTRVLAAATTAVATDLERDKNGCWRGHGLLSAAVLLLLVQQLEQ